MCNVCGIVSELRPESSYWRKMCEYITGAKKTAFQESGCTMSAKCDFYIKDIAGRNCFALCDGEISNYKRIKQSLELRGIAFEGESLSELVLLSYFAFGKSVFKIFHGGFSIVIWDGYEKELVLARDKIGLRQFFYYYDGRNIAFASDIKSVLKFPFVKNDFCDDIYCKLFTLAGSRLTFETLFDKIFEVPQGSVVVYNNTRLAAESYFSFEFDDTADNLRQTKEGFKHLIKCKEGEQLNEKNMNESEIFDKLCHFVDKTYIPSPYLRLADLSNFGASEKVVDFTSVFNIPGRFKLTMKSCENGDREFINDFLSTMPAFSYKNERDISKKEELYIKLAVVMPQMVSAKRVVHKNIDFPYLEESVVEYSLRSIKYREKLLKTCLKKPKTSLLKDNIKALKSLFYKKTKDADFMMGFVGKDELLRFTRLFPRPETMLYLLQADIWLNKFL